jgi:hypothetical protein
MRLLRKILRVVLWPLRFWRLALAGVLLLAAAHVIIDQVLLRKLSAQLEQIRREGRPVTYADLKLPEYTGIDNAYAVYEQVMDKLKKEPDAGSWKRYAPLVDRYVDSNPCAPKKDEHPLSAEEKLDLGNYLNKIQPALDLLHTSRDCRVCIIPDALAAVDFVNGDVKTRTVQMSSLSRMRELTRYAAAKGLWEYQQGNTDTAFDWFGVGLNIADNHKSVPTLLGELNRIGCVSIVLGAIQWALYEGDAPTVLPGSFAGELQKCLDQKVYSQTFEDERLYSNEVSVRMGLRAWRVLRPLFTLGQIRMNRFYLQLADLFKEPEFSRQEAVLDGIRQWSKSHWGMFGFTPIVAPAWLRSVEAIRRNIAGSDMCDIAIKLKQYRKEKGVYPDSLSELVQPLTPDPFSGNAFNYKREGDGFQIFSAGKKVTGEGKSKLETNFSWCAVK